jgi:predicted ABC-type ATPase
MQKRLLAELFQPVEKSLIVFAGPNGSGKSTLVEGLERKFAFANLDPDKVIAAGTQTAVGRQAVALRDIMGTIDRSRWHQA